MGKKSKGEGKPAEAEVNEGGDVSTEETGTQQLERERDEYMNNWRRAQADYQNLKRRQINDIDSAVRRAQQSVLENVLLVLDNLDMALSMQCTTDEAKNLLVGVEMTRKQIIDVLEREEVERIDVTDAFDPAVHQAIATVEVEDEAQVGQILEVQRSGWTHRGQVLRFAQVKVGALPVEEETSAEQASEADSSED